MIQSKIENLWIFLQKLKVRIFNFIKITTLRILLFFYILIPASQL